MSRNTIYVSLTGSNTPPYDSWATAATTLAAALLPAFDGDLVVMDDGVFLLSEPVVVGVGVTIASRNSKADTIIDGQNGRFCCLEVYHADAVVSNITIRNGGDWGLWQYNDVGGCDMRSGTLYGCDVYGCTGRFGGGVRVSFGGRASHCVIHDCFGYDGGGLHVHSEAGSGEWVAVDNCLVYHNHADNSGGGAYGGGLPGLQTGAMVNCTICDNMAGAGDRPTMAGGGTYGGLLYNCIVSYNDAHTPNSENIWQPGGDPDEMYRLASNCCSPESTGTYAIDVNPQFLDRTHGDYRIAITSECADAGDNVFLSGLDDYDLALNPRIKNGVVDIGAYESQFDKVSSSSTSSISSPSTVALSSSASTSTILGEMSTSSNPPDTSSKSTSSYSTRSTSSGSSSASSGSSPSSSLSTTSVSSQSSQSGSSQSSESSVSSSSSVYANVQFALAGEPYSQPSLVVDVAGQPAMRAETMEAFGTGFRRTFAGISLDRLRGDVGANRARWEFRGLAGDGNVANAFVLSGETVVIHVAALGHGAGYFEDASGGAVFVRHKLVVTLHDVIRGVRKSVSFDNFTSAAEDSSRYVKWVVGGDDAWNSRVRGATGLSGIFVLQVADDSQAYAKADFTGDPLPISCKGQDAWLQVVSVDWRDAIGRPVLSPTQNAAMMGNVEFRTAPIPTDTAMTEPQAFDMLTTFPSHEPASGLTDEQKTVVIRDNAMALLSSQLPLLPAEAVHAPAIGMGIAAVAQGTSIEVPSARPAASSKAARTPSRMFSLAGQPAAMNTLDTLASITPWHDQADCVARNPLRLLSFGQDGAASVGFDGGIGWALSGMSTSGVAFSGFHSCQVNVLLGDDDYGLDFDGDFVSSSSSLTTLSTTSETSESSASTTLSMMSESSLSTTTRSTQSPSSKSSSSWAYQSSQSIQSPSSRSSKSSSSKSSASAFTETSVSSQSSSASSSNYAGWICSGAGCPHFTSIDIRGATASNTAAGVLEGKYHNNGDGTGELGLFNGAPHPDAAPPFNAWGNCVAYARWSTFTPGWVASVEEARSSGINGGTITLVTEFVGTGFITLTGVNTP